MEIIRKIILSMEDVPSGASLPTDQDEPLLAKFSPIDSMYIGPEKRLRSRKGKDGSSCHYEERKGLRLCQKLLAMISATYK